MLNNQIAYDTLIREITLVKKRMVLRDSEILSKQQDNRIDAAILESYERLINIDGIAIKFAMKKDYVSPDEIVFNTITSFDNFIKLENICTLSGLSVNKVRNALARLKTAKKIAPYRPTKALKTSVYGLYSWVDENGNIIKEHEDRYIK